jgi:hypothetical protein
MNDYLYEYPQFSRFHNAYSEKWHAKQFINSEGGFATLNNNISISNDWMVALKFSHELPLLLRPYFNIAAYPDHYNIANHTFFYEGGIRFGIKDVFEIYFPFTYTKELEDLLINNNKLENRIRFVLNLNKINPINLLDKIPY